MKPIVTEDPRDVIKWLEVSETPFRVRLLSSPFISGKVASASYTVSASAQGRQTTFGMVAHTVYDREFGRPGPGEVTLDFGGAALWPNGVVVSGKIMDVSTWHNHPARLNHGQSFLRNDSDALRSQGWWFPELEITSVDLGFDLLIPSREGALNTWLLPGVGQLAGWPKTSKFRHFEAGVQSAASGRALVPGATHGIAGFGSYLARRGHRAFVRDAIVDLIDDVPEAAELFAQTEALADPETATELFEGALGTDHLDMLKLKQWHLEMDRARTYGLI